MGVSLLRGDCRAVLPTLGAGAFRCCVTSPPYWEQREYLPAGHPDKALELGHEPTPAEHVAALVLVFREVRRVLADDGTLWINVGDKYAGDGGRRAGGGHFGSHNRLVDEGRIPHKLPRWRTPGLPPKSLIGIPWRLAFGLQDDGWILRSEIIWHKPDAQPSSVVDRPTTSHEHLFLFAKNVAYHYNADAIREPQGPQKKRGRRHSYGDRAPAPRGNLDSNHWTLNPLGRNCRTVWTLPTSNGDGVHAAPMPAALARRCVLAGSAGGDEVLDPFSGSGTVGQVADEEGRGATLIDIDERSRGAGAQGNIFSTQTMGSDHGQ